MIDYTRKTYASIGDTVTMEISFSECAMSMQVAGKVMQATLLPSEGHGAIAQLIKEGQPYSAPILTGEAGFYHDDLGYYYYPVKVA
jgi:hypothetical protein